MLQCVDSTGRLEGRMARINVSTGTLRKGSRGSVQMQGSQGKGGEGLCEHRDIKERKVWSMGRHVFLFEEFICIE